MENTLFFVLKKFLEKEDFKVNLKELKFQLLSHPSYPSLHSLTGVLSHFGIDNLALKVPLDMHTLEQTPSHFISLTQDRQFMLVSRVGNKFGLLLENKEKKIVGASDFLKDWSGIVVAAEFDDESKQVANNRSYNSLSYGIYLLTGLILFSVIFTWNPNWFQTLQLGLSLCGLLISILIINRELGLKSKIADAFCSDSDSTSCDDVLNAKGATFFNFLKLSDLSVIYFLGLIIGWVFVLAFDQMSSIITLINVLAVLVTLYSIYYQYKIIKKWCPLCLGVVAVLWTQFGVLIIRGIDIEDTLLNMAGSSAVAFSFLLAASIWIFIRPLLNGKYELEKLKIEHYKFKRNFDLFLSVLNKGTHLEPDLPTYREKEIVLGNIQAKVSILLVTSPQCYYCKAAHRELENVLVRNLDEINLTFRFNVNAKDKSDVGNRVCSRLLELHETQPTKTLLKAMQEAYSDDSNLPKWLMEWGEPVNHEVYSAVLIEQQKWCIENEVHFTPAVYINGKEFPKVYNRTDLSFFIEDLTELVDDGNAIEKDRELINS